ncbi:hypothetical protein CRV24_008686 [Beauveria bassiana]|nr:hypothetical protein CRV24_008686 [Beauveria bassiana]KAH8715359.1 hypothetical protein HC256_004188 [Beauveria bassiana]
MVTNFMDLSICRTEFTAGQITRMHNFAEIRKQVQLRTIEAWGGGNKQGVLVPSKRKFGPPSYSSDLKRASQKKMDAIIKFIDGESSHVGFTAQGQQRRFQLQSRSPSCGNGLIGQAKV